MIAKVRRATERDAVDVLQMMHALWPQANPEELHAELSLHFRRPAAQAYFVAEDADGTLLGFVEAGLRSVADGCASSPVGYVEAWYVKPDVREKGVGKLLIASAEEWSREQGCSEIASDAEIENRLSIEVHKKLGFAEISRAVTFRKSLYP